MNIFTRKEKPAPSLESLPQTGSALHDPKREFAEVFGSALVGNKRMFILGMGMVGVAALAVIATWRVASAQVAVPWMFPVSESGGIMAKPVRLEPISPSKAVVKAELGKWLEQVYTIDSKQTIALYREANKRTSGKAIEQFREFRTEQDVMRKLKEQPDFMRTVDVHSVDPTTQEGLAFAYLTTKESAGSDGFGKEKHFRVTLHYTLNPPKTEQEILANPLGLYVTFFNSIIERR